MFTTALRLPLHGLRSQFLHWAYSQTYPLYARSKRQPRPVWQVNQQALLRHAPGTLGRRLGQFLQANELELIPGFENHDIFHVLLDYGLGAPEEVALQWCLLGNGKRSLFSFVAIFVGTACFPEYWGWFRKAYRQGKALRAFHHWYFEYLLQEDLVAMRRFLAGHEVNNDDDFTW